MGPCSTIAFCRSRERGCRAPRRGTLMQDWEKILESLGNQGWSYAYVKCIDLEKGTDTYYVSIRRGKQRLTSLRPSLEEAVRTLSLMAESAAG